jgi:CBS domain-containing protein
MAKLARDLVTADPAGCSLHITIDEIAKRMVKIDCGEIPIVDTGDRIVGVVTGRAIVSR